MGCVIRSYELSKIVFWAEVWILKLRRYHVNNNQLVASRLVLNKILNTKATYPICH